MLADVRARVDYPRFLGWLFHACVGLALVAFPSLSGWLVRDSPVWFSSFFDRVVRLSALAVMMLNVVRLLSCTSGLPVRTEMVYRVGAPGRAVLVSYSGKDVSHFVLDAVD